METYGEIYDNDFLAKFDNSTAVRNLKREQEDPVDVKAIAEALDINIDYTVGGPSGKCDCQNRTIEVNLLEPEYRQRFTIAHELGHILLDHKGIQYRDDDKERYKTLVNQMRERAANDFAANLLMPETLVRRLAWDIAIELEMDKGNIFSSFKIDMLIERLADLLGVSKVATRFRLTNLGILGDTDGNATEPQ